LVEFPAVIVADFGLGIADAARGGVPYQSAVAIRNLRFRI
jgi:hypothetical protein